MDLLRRITSTQNVLTPLRALSAAEPGFEVLGAEKDDG